FDIPVTPRGAGTGVTGGAIPVLGGAVLSLEKLNRIIEIDTDNMTATVEPGVKTGELQRQTLAKGLLYPPDPASLEDCSIGGNVAESAGGMRAVKYGTTKDYILGCEFVTPDGKIMRYGGKYVKNATGYNLLGILIGSEGTLAVITKLIVRLVPAPLETRDILFSFDSLEKAVTGVSLISKSRVIPTAIEFMEENALEFVARHNAVAIPLPDAKAHLLVQIDGNHPDELDRMESLIIGSLEGIAASHMTARTADERALLWSARRGIRSSIEKESPVFLAEDCVVPRSAIPSFATEVKNLLRAKNVRSVLFGHAGDGNVHINALRDKLSDDEWEKIVPEIKKGIYSIALRHEGTITGEHGIGCIRKDYMGLAFSKDEINLMKRIKHAFDPKGILNPGKVL
ncbi:MAG TPA: FAD-linked oxidase C-terminal domain-containing protein, partial [Spirochaetota bacterium]|nr:FAD-linked oxidase C-terminal domain-containing protein [Spirochaetota bacterium]